MYGYCYSDVTTEMNASDCERRMRIESSPVKSFYRTVPLDDTGIISRNRFLIRKKKLTNL